jgi:hypothetical protein
MWDQLPQHFRSAVLLLIRTLHNKQPTDPADR